jgi:Fungal specific transcription factor domain
VLARIREVKCDEDRYACRRCISTGRVCDGYGIWGGGGNLYGQRQRPTRSKVQHPVLRRLPAAPFVASDATEKGYYEWFKCRTSTKLPGTYISGFWDTLLFQASTSEPTVLHAVLALSSVHKRETTSADGRPIASRGLDWQEQFMLQQYVKATNSLQPHFSTKDRASSRVALIACAVLVCTELLRGHFQTAQLHLRHGIKILREMGMLPVGKDEALCWRPTRGSVED